MSEPVAKRRRTPISDIGVITKIGDGYPVKVRLEGEAKEWILGNQHLMRERKEGQEYNDPDQIVADLVKMRIAKIRGHQMNKQDVIEWTHGQHLNFVEMQCGEEKRTIHYLRFHCISVIGEYSVWKIWYYSKHDPEMRWISTAHGGSLIPQIHDDELKRKAGKCRQLALEKERAYVASIEPNDDFSQRGSAYTWDPSKRKVGDLPRDWLNKTTPFAQYPTFHTYGYPLLFKPSVAEIMAQLPDTVFIDPNARYLIRTEPFSEHAPTCAIDDDHHLAVTSIYLDKGEEMQEREVIVIPDDSDVKMEQVDTCCICMTEPADTMVLPCMHQVVCKECSEGLKNTRDARTCVRCRRPITNVMMDNTTAIAKA